MPERRIGRAFLGRLAYGLDPLGAFGWRVGRSFLGLMASRPFPFRAHGSGRLARGVGLGPKVPIMPHFSCRGGRPSPIRKKNKVDCHIIGNNLPLMLPNFQRNFFLTFL